MRPLVQMGEGAEGGPQGPKSLPSLPEGRHSLGLRPPLLQASFSPAFLHRPEGRRFLASLFNLDKDFVGELTAIIKNQVWGVGFVGEPGALSGCTPCVK